MTVLAVSSDDAAKVEWYLDTLTRNFIAIVLQPAELEEFDQLKFGRVPWLQRMFESKILSAVEVIISGQQSGAESLEQARELQRLAVDVEVQTRRDRATQSPRT
jgi:hypothetical protein